MREHSLTGRLVALYVLVLTLALTLVATITLAIMSRVLTNQIDDDLTSTGATVAQQTIDKIRGTSTQVLPSPYYVYVERPSLASLSYVSPSMEARYGAPADITEVFDADPFDPVTIAGNRSGTSWRALYLTTNSHDIPAVALAYPLKNVHDTTSRMTFLIVTIAAIVIGIGTLASYLIVQRSLRPLRLIERTTQKIASGDLSQRVPTAKMGVEVGHLAASINSMLGQIEAAMAARERSEGKMRQFVSDASHELRTPLASVRGYAELFRMGGIGPDKVPQAMQRIESESARMGVLVEDLLQLARLDESRSLSLSQVDLADLAEGAILDFMARSPEYPTRLVGLGTEEPAPAWAIVDRDRISQVIANLLTNVKQHTPTGTSVEVAVGTQEVTSAAGRVDMAVIEVRDHGPGIPPEQRAKVFERFYRVDTSRARSSGGSGLGLAIVSSIAAAHRGSARISETPGGGTTVTLTFPAAPLPEQQLEP